MMFSNMLSSQKVKQHGIKSRRWTTKDKITQFRGLLNLYNRDKKIVETDNSIIRKVLKKEVKNLRRQLYDQRDELENAFRGDRQKLRNTLAENRQLQLAYQNLPPTRVIDAINQDNFNKKKTLDRAIFKMKQKTSKLIDLKLEYAELEDRIKYEKQDQIPVESKAQYYMGKVKDAVLKHEAALSVKNTYNNIINILKKDAIYFDAVLRALQIDGYNQGKCIYRITEMGQLATEYLDDRRQQYKALEKDIKKSMKQRMKSLQQVQDQLEEINNNAKYLIRRDSIIDICEVKPRYTPSQMELLASIEFAELILDRLKDVVMVSRFDSIFPRMEDQLRQKMRLEELVQQNVQDRDTLLNKSHHVEEMFYTLNHTMVTTTVWYNEEKARLKSEIQEQVGRKARTDELIKHRSQVYMDVRTSLQQMSEVLRNVSQAAVAAPPRKEGTVQAQSGSPRKETVPAPAATPRKEAAKVEFDDRSVVVPTHVEEDALKLIPLITQKLTPLIAAAQGKELDGEELPHAIEAYLEFVNDMTDKTLVIAPEPKEEFVMEEIFLEDPQVPSRAEIKARSQKIVNKFSRSEFDTPVALPKKK